MVHWETVHVTYFRDTSQDVSEGTFQLFLLLYDYIFILVSLSGSLYI